MTRAASSPVTAFFCLKQKRAYEIKECDWSSDVCSSDLPAAVSGLVHDSSGGAVVGAVVIVRPATGPERQTVTGPDGRFAITLPDSGDATLIVRAGGFAEKQQRITSGDRTGDIDVEVVPAAVLETVTVTPSRTEQTVANIPASIDVVTADR